MDRRQILKLLSLASTFAFLHPKFLFAAEAANKEEPILVVVFLRGAMDGLSFLPPLDEPLYTQFRPNIAVQSLKLADGFGLHPTLTGLRSIYQNGEASFVFEAGSPANTRSHFDAQDWMESGITQMGGDSGFLARAFAGKPTHSPFQTIAIQNGLPRILKGMRDPLAFTDFKSLKTQGPLTHERLEGATKDSSLDPAVFSLFAKSQDDLFKGAAKSLLEGATTLPQAEEIFEQEKAQLPKGVLAKNLAHISAMIRSKVGVRVAITEMGGWDTHVNQGNANGGSLKDRFSELDTSVAWFWKSLDKLRDSVCVVLMTEFGRTVKENGDRGTDHGHGSVMTILSSRLKNPKIHHRFEGLKPEKLFENRDLQVRFDYRQVYHEVLAHHMQMPENASKVFPGFVTDGKIGLF